MNRHSVPIRHDDAQSGDIGLTDTIRVLKTEIADLATRLDRIETTERASRDHTLGMRVEWRLHSIVEDIIAQTYDDLCTQPLSWTVPALHKIVAERIAEANTTLRGERTLAIPCIATVYKRVQALECGRTPYRLGAPHKAMTTEGSSHVIPRRVEILRRVGHEARASVVRLVEDTPSAPLSDVTNEGGDAPGNGKAAESGGNWHGEDQDDDDEEDD